MSRRRNRSRGGQRRRGSGGQDQQAPDQQPKGAEQGGGGQGDGGGKSDGGGKGNRGGGSRSRGRGSRRRGRGRRPEGVGFWGDAGQLPDPTPDIRLTSDPAAVARSLGTPPLPGHEQIAGHYFAAVYDRAVATAGALAAAGGLIEPDELADELGDDDTEA
ncbi:MAG: hypothetical protein KY457_06650 [Actinobacteria bacterium]|nr:hypothetical protein [Actinomycetota bacterium]